MSSAAKNGLVVLTVSLILTLLLSVPALTQTCATVLSMFMTTKFVSLSRPVDSHRGVPATTIMARAASAMVATRILVAISAASLIRSMAMITATIMISRVLLSVREKVQAKEIND